MCPNRNVRTSRVVLECIDLVFSICAVVALLKKPKIKLAFNSLKCAFS